MKKIVVLTAILAILMGQGLRVSAFEYENYDTAPVSESEKVDYSESINLRILTVAADSDSISDFAVSEQGSIALAFNSSADAQVNVYNSEGAFQYGLCFLNHRSSFVVFFTGENLSIYWYKSGYIGSFDADGTLIQLRKCLNSKKNLDSYHFEKNKPSSGNIGGTQYYMESNWISGYMRFIIENDNGYRTVIYDATETECTRHTVSTSLLLSGFLFVMFIIYKYKKEENQH